MTRYTPAWLTFLVMLLGLGATSAGTLGITFLANEGLLFRAGDDTVIIDGLVSQPYSGYGALPESVLERALTLEPPFDSVDITLVSHIHRDHFQPGPAVEFLLRSVPTRLFSSPDVVEAVLARPEADSARERIAAVWPDPGEVITKNHEGIRIDFLHLSHGSGRFAEIQNLGHVIHLGGKRILHLGDAAMQLAQFAEYDFPSRKIDIALIPYWYFGTESGQKLIDGYLKAPTMVAVHIPPGDLDEVRKSLAERYPEVIVFDDAMSSRKLP